MDHVDDEFDKIDDAVKTAGSIGLIIVVVIDVVQILFDIWTIFVAKNAKKRNRGWEMISLLSGNMKIEKSKLLWLCFLLIFKAFKKIK